MHSIFKFLRRKPSQKSDRTYIKFARYTSDDILILATGVGQFTIKIDSLHISKNSSTDDFSFIFSRTDENNRIENFDLKIDNSLEYREKNKEIIEKFNAIKEKRKNPDSQ